ncbi:YdgH/BhsA/McbA family protein [Budvicia aquatica]|uniref:DUF1471 domain-containing protein n=1 Tax=Budvicia aquatica TaxID=82979 RepID=A0A2C6CMS1_9GAMM|nr:DUF1471 domain-containing protein [Budvicia aquatica]MBP9643823.1 DUF1471 domain-containing protein [Budvicia sp.]PHI27949.1 DUF1471 domain-containing protein [Budvicia aquatica]GKX50742.1 hypothetical protein SOASR029_10510 [Budvicia aquatica]VFS45692.1 Protein of uncharacterised function (DUF1471) [Budvicia aquatica]
MKALKTFTIALAVSSFSFGALAATEITQAQVKQNNYQQLGAVGSTNEAMDPMDVKKILSEKADKMGGQYYVIIAASENEKARATADVYK